MAKKSLAIKYRPHTFDDVVEQGAIKTILRQQLEDNETKNAYLFCGGAGTGKTTCARIFANEINHFEGNPIEMDAASNSSVDDVREIIQQAKTKSLESEYKVFIIDECFPGNALVNTNRGNIPIREVTTSDFVLSMSGVNKVTHLFKNRVLTNRLCCVMIGNRKVITTVEHLFFTDSGWMCAKDLRKGDIVYAYNVSKDLSSMWERVSSSEQSQDREVLFEQLCNEVSVFSSNSEAKTDSSEGNKNLPNMWKTIYSPCDGQSEDLFKELRNTVRCEVVYSVDEYRMWDGQTETIIRKNVEEQSYARCGHGEQDVGNEREEWDTPSVAYNSGRKWEIHNSTDSLVASIRRWLGIGVSDKYKESELSRTSTTLVLQSRPWLFSEEIGSRGRWSRPQLESSFIEGCKEDGLFAETRVESVEIYKRGNNDELFLDSFTDNELSGKYVTMYDLEIENDHCYTVNDILVHNCHSISNTGWQAFLKLLEEPPAKSIFIFCTTDPQKIPKTILSRVQRYDFNRISHKGVVDRLTYILNAEQNEANEFTNIDPAALDYIAKIADGGMRDAITMMDKCLSFSSTLSLENVVKALGVADYETMIDLSANILINKQQVEILNIIEEVHRSGKDLKQFIKTYTNFVLDLNKYVCTQSFDYLETPKTFEKDVKRLTDTNTLKVRVLKLLQVLIKLNADIKWETSPKAVIEATLIILCEEFINDRTD